MDSPERYFDLFTTGVGYLNRIREMTSQEGDPFVVVSIAALRGGGDNVRYTYFDGRVSGQPAHAQVRQLMDSVANGDRVLVRFRIFDLYPNTFKYQRGPRAGEIGASVRGRLLGFDWAKVNGKGVELVQRKVA